MNLFIHILQAPSLPTVDSDLLLMEIGASHFIRLELITQSQISTPFAKDITRMARSVVERARNSEKQVVNADLPTFERSDILPNDPSGMLDLTAPQVRDFADNSFDEVSCHVITHETRERGADYKGSGSTCSLSLIWRCGALSFR